MWEVAWDLWQLRVDIIKKGNTAVDAITRNTLRQQIQQWYSEYRTNPLPSLTQWFTRSRQEIEGESIENQKQWVQQIDALQRLEAIRQPISAEDSD